MKADTLFLIFICDAFAPFSTGEASSGCGAKSPDEISQIFDHAIDINDRFKVALRNRDNGNYNILRHEVEDYSEEIAFPCARRAAGI